MSIQQSENVATTTTVYSPLFTEFVFLLKFVALTLIEQSGGIANSMGGDTCVKA